MKKGLAVRMKGVPEERGAQRGREQRGSECVNRIGAGGQSTATEARTCRCNRWYRRARSGDYQSALGEGREV